MSLSNILKTFSDEKAIVETEPLRFEERDKDGVSLKGVLQRGRLKLSREVKPRRQGATFRPSSITYGFCERLKVGQLAGLIEIEDSIPTPKLQLIFDIGNAIHDIIQGYFWDIGILKGSFECLKCNKTYHNQTAPTVCPSGRKTHKRKHFRYKEIQLRNRQYRISGRCDGFLDIEGQDHIFDIKSIANRQINTPQQQTCFEDLDQPKEAHVIQLQLYLWMADIEQGHLLYVGKNNHQIKSFAISKELETISPILKKISSLLKMSEQIKNGKPTILPECCGDEKCQCHLVLGKNAA